MRNFKKISVRVAVVVLAAFLFEWAVRLCYEPWNDYTCVSKRARAELAGTLDTLYIGTSLTYRSIDPRILDEKLGTNSFNLATSAQPLMGTYYLLREAVEENPIKTIYLGMAMPSLKQKQKDIRYVSAYENLRSWKWKLRYLLAVHQESVLTSSVLYSTRVETYTHFSAVRSNLRHKMQDAANTSSRYEMRGFRPVDETYRGELRENRNRRVNSWIKKRGMAQTQKESVKYLEKIAKLCKDAGIQLVLFVPPTTQDYLDAAGNLADWDQFCQSFADEWGATCYNFFNYKDRARDFPDEVFQDEKHLNGKGAVVFSNLLAEIAASENPQEYFLGASPM